jgi:hypothetical protein
LTFIVANSTPSGPVVTAWIGWDVDTTDFALKQGTQPPDWISLSMLVDTGATISSISGDVIQSMHLSQRDTIKVKTASLNAVEDRPVYYASLHLSDVQSTSSHRIVRVIEYSVGADGVQGLLGWDVLQHCSIVYNKDTRLFSLDF